MLSALYKPMTAQPFLRSSAYAEFAPCEALRPYIACFWGNDLVAAAHTPDHLGTLVVPDTCADVIFELNPRTMTLKSRFVGLSDTPWVAGAPAAPLHSSCFAIRFYFWSAHLFLSERMKNTFNASGEADAYFDGWSHVFHEILARYPSTRDRIRAAEQFLLSRLDTHAGNRHVLNATHFLLTTRGTRPVSDVCAHTGVSARQLEHLFTEHVGASVKKLSMLVRYQNVWREVLSSPHFDTLDAVSAYGFTDQAHLLNEFRRYHGVTPRQARRHALERI